MNRDKTKILYVVNNLDFLMSHRKSLLLEAKAVGYSVHVAAPAAESMKELSAMGVSFHPWQLSRKGINPLAEFKSIRSLYKIYQEVGPDLIHHVTIKPIIYGSLAARLAKIPATVNAVSGLGHVYISESFKTKLVRKITNFGYALSAKHPHARFIFQNTDDEGFFLNNRLVTKEKSHIIPGSGVCMQTYQPLPLPAQEKLVIVLAARMIREKGIQEFVEAASLLKTRTHLEFVLVGGVDTGNPSAITEQALLAWNQLPNVSWWGYQADMQKVLSQCHIACLPSYREGSPRFLIEAAACGRAIITTDTPGCRDLVNPGVNGLLVPVKDAKALSEAIAKLTDNPAILEKMGLASRALVESRYSQESVLSDTFEVYHSLHS